MLLWKLSIWAAVWLALLLAPGRGQTTRQQQDANSLCQWYLQTNIAALSGIKGWNCSASGVARQIPCGPAAAEWTGVSCTAADSTGAVKGLSLNNKGIKGKLTASLGNISTIESIELGKNSLSGSIPSEWFTLKNSLYKINLQLNSLSGTFPVQITKLTSLTSFISSGNLKVSGPLPEDMAPLTKLNYFDVAFMNLNGTLPANFSHLKSISYMRLRENNFHGKSVLVFLI